MTSRVNVFCSGDMVEAIAALVRAGLSITQVLPRLHVVSGTIDPSKWDELASVPGVKVEPDYRVSAASHD